MRSPHRSVPLAALFAALILPAAAQTGGQPEAGNPRRPNDAGKAELRERLRRRLAAIFETGESPRGLVVTVADAQFDLDRHSLTRAAREKLAQVSGILLAHPGLKVGVEGHSDDTGSDDYNQKLSAQRAAAVRDCLVAQGVSPDDVSVAAFGKTRPAASNDTAEGRRRNRRVELVISGEPIGIEGPAAPG